MTTINDTLAERGKRYGEFTGHARVTQNIKRAMQDSDNWLRLDDDMREALEMVAHKVGRILNGDPAYDDSWRDIAGYVTLVENRLSGKGDDGKTRTVPEYQTGGALTWGDEPAEVDEERLKEQIKAASEAGFIQAVPDRLRSIFDEPASLNGEVIAGAPQ